MQSAETLGWLVGGGKERKEVVVPYLVQGNTGFQCVRGLFELHNYYTKEVFGELLHAYGLLSTFESFVARDSFLTMNVEAQGQKRKRNEDDESGGVRHRWFELTEKDEGTAKKKTKKDEEEHIKALFVDLSSEDEEKVLHSLSEICDLFERDVSGGTLYVVQTFTVSCQSSILLLPS